MKYVWATGTHVGRVRENNEDTVFPAADGSMVPAQDIPGSDSDPRMVEALVCYVGFPPGPAFLLLPFLAILQGMLATQWIGALLGGLAVAVIDRS